MPRKPLYPFDPSSGKLESTIINFYKNGKRPNGGNGWPDRDFPVEHYRYIGIKGREGEPNKTIESSSVKLIFHCDKHNVDFETTLRKLFNCASSLTVIHCKHCASELGYGKTLHTFKSLRELFAKYPEWPFTLELPFDTPNLEIFTTKDQVPIRCTKDKFGSNIPCNEIVHHSVSNIKFAMEHPDKEGIICCQGECDSKVKGKAKRKNFDEFNDDLISKTKGEWRFSPNQSYTTSSQKYWFTHQCGYEIYITQYQLLNVNDNDKKFHLCPCCDKYLPIKLIEGRLDLFKRWLDVLTDSKLEYLSNAIPSSSREELPFCCRNCDSLLKNNLENIRTNKYRGCNTCAQKAINSQRVQAVDSECEIRRGFRVVGELTSVDETYDFISQNGEISTCTLIEQIGRASCRERVCLYV